MVGLIAASLVLITVASIALGFGWLGANSGLVWVSILCSAATAVALSVAYSKSRQMADNARRARTPRRAARARGAGVAAGGFAMQAMARPNTRSRDRVSPNDGEVVAVPDRRKFHRPDCRYARVKGATRMAKSTARRRNFDACGICKP